MELKKLRRRQERRTVGAREIKIMKSIKQRLQGLTRTKVGFAEPSVVCAMSSVYML